MLKYLYCKEVFREVPNEISLGISISGCSIRCKGCHSRELWEDKGIDLTMEELQRLMDNHKGITCVLILGGEHNIDYLTEIFKHIYGKIKTAWYCGLDMIPKDKQDILKYLDYVKIGHYDSELGGLDCKSTNQKFFLVRHRADNYEMNDLTYKFQTNN